MARLIAMYRTPKDPATFDKYYFETHVPLAKTIPGLKRYEVSRGAIASPAGTSGLYLVATLHFNSLAEVQAAFATPEGQATAADLKNFASGGVDLVYFDNDEI